MKQKKEEKPPEKHSARSLRTFLFFCLVVVLIILVSLSYRIFQLTKNSKFDGSSGFIMAVLQEDGKKAVIYTVDPLEESLSQVVVSGRTSLPNLRQELSLPIEGRIKKKTVSETTKLPLEFTSYSLYSQPDALDISFIDAIRLWLYSQTVSQTNTRSLSLTWPDDQERFGTDAAQYFIDSRLEKDKQSIRIVNGTSVSGLGGRLDQLLGRVGASVISVTTSHGSIQASKIIYYGEKSYTVERLSKVIPFPLEQREGTSISDILIEIGEDSQRTTLF